MLIALSILFVVLIFFSFLDFINIQKKVKRIILFFICPILIFLITFRFGVGDYDSYIEIFQKVSFSGFLSQNSDVHGEVGFLYLNNIVKLFGGNVKIVFCIVGIFSIFFTVKFYTKYTKYYIIALLVYFSHVFLLREMIQIRSGLAISIVMFSVPYIVKRNLIKFSIIILIASLLHSICLLFILVYILYPYLLSTKSQIVLLLIGFILGLIFNLSLVQKILSYLNVPQIVLDYSEDNEYNFKLGLLNPVLIKQVLVLIILYYNKEYFQKVIPYFDALLIIYTIGTFWFSTFNSFAILSARVNTMFSNVEHVLIPSLLLINRYKTAIYIFILIYCMFSFLSKWEMLSNWSFSF